MKINLFLGLVLALSMATGCDSDSASTNDNDTAQAVGDVVSQDGSGTLADNDTTQVQPDHDAASLPDEDTSAPAADTLIYDTVACAPSCPENSCGDDDGCGGTCEECEEGFNCIEDQCEAVNPNLMSCDMIIQCINDCPEGDEVCPQDCYNESSPEAQGQYMELINCLDGAGYFECADEACMQAIMEGECAAPVSTCFGGGGTTGDLTCGEMIECMNNCPEGDEACPQGCFDNSTAAAQGQYQAVITCLDAAGYFDCADEACMTDIMNGECAAQTNTCFGGGGTTGDLACSEMLECMNNCPEADLTCPQGCYDNSTAAAQGEYQAMLTCIDGAGYFDCADEACMEAIMEGECAAPVNSCFGA
jgi:hypothetical protein